MTQDHPRVRASLICPVCEQAKDYGLVVCWPCYRKHGLRYGNPVVDDILDRIERLLEIDEGRLAR
jgi:hypothetical protein